MFCHDASRYILFLPGLVKADFADLGRLHRELFLATLVKQRLNVQHNRGHPINDCCQKNYA